MMMMAETLCDDGAAVQPWRLAFARKFDACGAPLRKEKCPWMQHWNYITNTHGNVQTTMLTIVL